MIKKLLSNNFSKDLIITVVGQMIIMLLALVVNKINSLNLGPEMYSIFYVSKRSVGVISGIMAIALGIAIPRFISMTQYKDKKATFMISALLICLGISLLVFLVMLIFENWFSIMIFGSSNYISLVMPMVLYSFSVAISTLIYSYYRGCNRYYMYNISQIVVNLVMLIVAIFVKKSIFYILLLWGIFILISCIIFLILIFSEKSNKEELKNFKNPIKEIKMLSVFSFPRLFGEMALFSFTTIPLIIIAHRQGIEQNYLISTPINLMAMITPLFSFAGIILLPYVSKATSEGKVDEVKKPILYMGILYIIASLCAIGFIILFPKFVINLFFSSEFLDAISVTVILIWAVLPASIYYLLRNPIDALSRIPFNTINLVISFGVLCGLMYLFNDNKGYAYAFIIGYTVLCILSIISYLICMKRVKNKFKRKEESV